MELTTTAVEALVAARVEIETGPLLQQAARDRLRAERAQKPANPQRELVKASLAREHGSYDASGPLKRCACVSIGHTTRSPGERW